MSQVEHYSVCVGYTNNRKAMMRDFIDPRPILGDDAYNSIADREWDAGPVNPTTKLAAVAVELVDGKRKGTYEVATHEYENSKGEDVTAVNVGVMIQSPTVFWSWFQSYADRKGTDLLGEVFSVERVEGSSPIKYNIIPLGEGLELDEEVTDAIDLDEYLESLMDEERFKELIDVLDDDHILNRYSQKGGKDDKKSSKSSSRKPARSRAAKAAEPEADDPDNEPSPEDDPAEDRKEAFNALKDALGKK